MSRETTLQACDLQTGDELRVTVWNSIGRRGEWWRVTSTSRTGRVVTVNTNRGTLTFDAYEPQRVIPAATLWAADGSES